jgi:hypothetical protein
MFLPAPRPPGYTGHPHFWHRALSRRRFVQTAAGATALVVGNGLWFPFAAAAGNHDDPTPRPIPGGNDFLGDGHFVHVFPPAYGQELSTITDFNGFIAAAEIQGAGTGTDTQTHATTRYYFDADMRFMDGVYVATDGKQRTATFGFV